MNKKISAFFLVLGALLSAPRAVQARQARDTEVFAYLLSLSMEELTKVPVQSSGLFAMNWDETPGISYVVDKEQLDKAGIRTLGEYVNRLVPGMSTAIHGTQGVTIGVRGILIDNTAKTLLLRDNINLNNRKFVGINGSELSTPLLGDIDSIEVTLGPGIMRHGSGAINGSLNVITSTGKSKPGWHFTTTYGSGDSRTVEGSYGHAFGERANLFLYAGYNKSNGVRPHYTFPASMWDDLDAKGINGTPSEKFLDEVRVGKTDDDYKFSLRGQFTTADGFFNLDLKAMLSHTSNVDPVLGEYLSPSADWREEVRLAAEAREGRYSPFYEQLADNLLISPEITFNFNADNQLQVIPYYHTIETVSVFSDFLQDEVDRLGISLRPVGTPDCEALNCAEEYTYGDETHIGLTLIHKYSGFNNQRIAWGAEAKYFEFKTHPWYWTTVSGFGEDQVRLGNFSFLAGLRYDKTYFEDEIDTIPPYDDGPYEAPDDVEAWTMRLAASYHIDDKQTVKISYQEGFRFPDAWFQQWNAHLSQAGGADYELHPEESQSYEVNYTGLGLMNDAVNLYASAFYNIYTDTLAYSPIIKTFDNSPKKLKSAGGELTLELTAFDRFEGRVSYSFAHPIDSYEPIVKIANDDDTWTRYPEHMIKFQLGYDILPGLFASATGTATSPFYEKAEVNDPRVENLFDDWTFVMDAALHYSINEHARLTFSAKELLHENYNQMPSYFNGTRPLDAPRADDPQFYLTFTYRY